MSQQKSQFSFGKERGLFATQWQTTPLVIGSPGSVTGNALVVTKLPSGRLLARARQWYEWVIAGKVWGGRSIAHKTGFDERHVSQILECAFLAPDIVEAILDGRQPGDLTWKKLTRHVPMNWVEQRKQLGFPPASFTSHKSS